jgi:hypothetical protein
LACFAADPLLQAKYDLHLAEVDAGKVIEQTVTPRARTNKKGSGQPVR